MLTKFKGKQNRSSYQGRSRSVKIFLKEQSRGVSKGELKWLEHPIPKIFNGYQGKLPKLGKKYWGKNCEKRENRILSTPKKNPRYAPEHLLFSRRDKIFIKTGQNFQGEKAPRKDIMQY